MLFTLCASGCEISRWVLQARLFIHYLRVDFCTCSYCVVQIFLHCYVRIKEDASPEAGLNVSTCKSISIQVSLLAFICNGLQHAAQMFIEYINYLHCASLLFHSEMNQDLRQMFHEVAGPLAMCMAKFKPSLARSISSTSFICLRTIVGLFLWNYRAYWLMSLKLLVAFCGHLAGFLTVSSRLHPAECLKS